MCESKRLYTADAGKKQYFHNFKSEKILNVVTVENGYIFPALDPEKFDPIPADYGVRNSEKEFVELSAMRPMKQILPYYNNYNEPAEFIDEKVIYCGVASFLQYGHFLLESLFRLWYVLKHQEDKSRIAFIPIGAVGKYAGFFELLGIPMDRIIFVNKPMQFAEIVVPEMSSTLGEDYTDEFLLPYERIMESVPAGPYKKIYMTRRKFAFSGICGEEYIENLFKMNGYKIISPEEFSVKEQVSLMKGAESVVSFLGSATHNAVFAKEGTEFIILNRADNVCCIQMLVNQAKKLKYYYVDAYLDGLPSSYFWGPALVGNTPYLNDFFKDKGFHVPQNSFKNPEKLIHEYISLWFSVYGYSEKIFGRLAGENAAVGECFSYEQLHYISRMVNYKKNRKELFKNKRHFLSCLIFSKILFGKRRLKYAGKTEILREKIKRLARETDLSFF